MEKYGINFTLYFKIDKNNWLDSGKSFRISIIFIFDAKLKIQ